MYSLYSMCMDIKHFQVLSITPLMLLIGLSASHSSYAASNRQVNENQYIKMVVIPRTPQQMAAFYEGREFPKTAIDETRSACFFTTVIHNKSKNIIQHDYSRWQLNTDATTVSLISKQQWKQRWKQLNIPQRFQSTFRWTLLPEQLDFQAAEHEGGNITILRQAAPFDLVAYFTTVEQEKIKTIRMEFKNLRCAEDTPQ